MKRIFCAVLMMPLLTGCVADMFRAKIEKQKVDIEYYSPDGRPKKFGRIVDNRPIDFEYTAQDGTTWVEKVKLGGFNASPPALATPPKPLNPADEAIINQYLKDWRDGKLTPK